MSRSNSGRSIRPGQRRRDPGGTGDPDTRGRSHAMPGPSLVRGGVGSEQDSAAPPIVIAAGQVKRGATARYVPAPARTPTPTAKARLS